MDNDIERQKKLEADAVRDGLLRYAKSYEYHLATDSKPVRDVLGHCLKPLADVIRAEQLKLKTSQGQKLEKYVIPLASVCRTSGFDHSRHHVQRHQPIRI